MKIFIIGGTGFISSHLTGQLLKKGYEVTIFNRGLTRSNIESHENLIIKYGDRNDTDQLSGAVNKSGYDAVFDMMAFNPEQTKCAERIFRGKTGRFIHCSTVSVYMISDEVSCPVTEDQYARSVMPDWPRNPFGMGYGIEKRRCEEYLWERHHNTDFPVTILRPTYVSGPGDPARRDYFWIQRILDGQPLLVPGSGDCAFQQVYVEDVASVFASVLDFPMTIGEAYNVAGEEIFSLNEYLDRLAKLLARNIEKRPVDQKLFDNFSISHNPEGDVFPFNTRRTAVFSLKKLIKDTDFRGTPFDHWMMKTIDWFINRYTGDSTGYDKRDLEIDIIRKLKQGEKISNRG